MYHRYQYQHRLRRLDDDDDLADFWRKENIFLHLPTLANLALDILTLSVSSAEVERVSLVAGLVFSDHCNCRKGIASGRILMMKNRVYAKYLCFYLVLLT